jgi:uncharacterized protein YjbI with pentapeptide repeats
MTDRPGVEWPTCDEDRCIGSQLARGGKCLAHATARRRNAALKRFAETGNIDARGVPITNALLRQLLTSAPRNAEDRPTFTAVRFQRATFCGDADFGGATFQGHVWFAEATFQGDAEFVGATFRGGAYFDRATFQGDAEFAGATLQDTAMFSEANFRRLAHFRATFQGNANFERAIFWGDADFAKATFRRIAWFGETTFHGTAGLGGVKGPATFEGDADFAKATFRRIAWFGMTTFQGFANFAEATFQGDAEWIGTTFQNAAWFGGAIFRRDAKFVEAKFEKEDQLGPLLVYDLLRLDAAHFAQPIRLEVSARWLACHRARFSAGAQFRLRGAQTVLDDADLSGPSILVGIAALSDARLAKREQRLVQALRRLAPQDVVELSARPRLLSVQGADVAGLTVSNVDLSECRFAGAHNLDRLRLEAEVTFSQAHRSLPWDWRQVIAEEHAWRARSQVPPPPGVLPAGQIAGLYRALRKGREDAKDEPGAADFYYGEMEMRRHARRPASTTDHPSGEASRGRVERVILTAYWLVSGYGLRAWRALAWLAAVTAGFALAFHLAGFTRPPQPDTYWTSLLYAFRATLSLTDPEVQLTAWGKLLQALLRLTGPVLLGLTLLAIRARTKR